MLSIELTLGTQFIPSVINGTTSAISLIAGLFALSLIYLGYTGIISVNYTNLAGAIGGLLGNLGGASQLLSPIIANLPFGGSFVVGATMGFKKE